MGKKEKDRKDTNIHVPTSAPSLLPNLWWKPSMGTGIGLLNLIVAYGKQMVLALPGPEITNLGRSHFQEEQKEEARIWRLFTQESNLLGSNPSSATYWLCAFSRLHALLYFIFLVCKMGIKRASSLQSFKHSRVNMFEGC